MNFGYGLKGKWVFECFNSVGDLIWSEYIFNKIFNDALDNNLDVQFAGGTAYSSWYILLFSSASTPTATWTYANIGTDFTEFVDYDESIREEWVYGSVSSQAISNVASPAEFTASTGVDTTIYGACLCNVSTKDDNSSPIGLLISGSSFNTARPFAETETLRVVYSITASSLT